MVLKKNILIILLTLSANQLIGSISFYNSFSQFSSNIFTVKSQLLGKSGYSSLRGSNAVFLNPANLVSSNCLVSFSSYSSFETMIDYSQFSTNFPIYGYSLGIGIATKIIDDIIQCQGTPIDIGGYNKPDPVKTEKALRPSETFNNILGN